MKRTEDQKLRELELLKAKAQLKRGLPHIHGYPYYAWQREFMECENRYAVLCAANQIGKSSIQMRRVILWATDQTLWPKLWKTRPWQFWYLYPTKEVATIEFETKWVKEYLPSGEYKSHPAYGWRAEYRNRNIFAIHFNSGVTCYFKTYATDASALQTGTCWYVACFVKGTLVITSRGLKAVEDVKLGDEVLTQNGWHPVTRTLAQESKVITRKFRSGEIITGTADHPFWTQEGWVNFGDLTTQHVCRRLPAWTLIKNLYYLKARYSHAIRNLKTIVIETISAQTSVDFYTSPYGKLSTSPRCHKATSSITKTLIHSTTDSLTYSALHEPITRESIKKTSGNGPGFGSSNAITAPPNLRPEVQRNRCRDSAHRNAAKRFMSKSVNALYVALISLLAKIHRSDSVLRDAPIEESTQTVYNLTVANSPTYFANGILTHNCDEELPAEIYPEINMRIQATRGYFSMVFTATLNQAFWFDVIEAKGKNERFTNWWKKQISMYDCQYYEDGQASMWTRERINQVINSCGTETEVQRRVFGRFVTEKGLKYPSFNRERNIKLSDSVPSDWLWYSGIDIGSGGADNHPAAICLVAISPNMQRGRVVRSWRGDNQMTTTASDVVNKYREMRGERVFAGEYYDWAAKDFETIAVRSGIAIQPAEKSHEIGESLLNTLFKNQMLDIDDTDENKDLVDELSSLLSSTKKTKAKDDAIDSLRYACSKIPWNFEGITTDLIKLQQAKALSVDEQRRAVFTPEAHIDLLDCEQEISFWNEQYDFGEM